MFRHKPSVPLPYNRQGLIFFYALNFKKLPADRQQRIKDICFEVGGPEYEKALFTFLTTDRGATAVCMDYALSRATLWRYVKKCYIKLNREIFP